MVDVLKSPAGEAALVEVSVGGITLFKDPETGGYWLRSAALQRLAELQETPLEEVHTGETLRVHQGRFCPEDATPLQEFEFEDHSGVKVDICPQCSGLWLDAGDLTNLLAYLDDYEFGEHLGHEDHLGIGDRVLMFLYQLTARPPLY